MTRGVYGSIFSASPRRFNGCLPVGRDQTSKGILADEREREREDEAAEREHVVAEASAAAAAAAEAAAAAAAAAAVGRADSNERRTRDERVIERFRAGWQLGCALHVLAAWRALARRTRAVRRCLRRVCSAAMGAAFRKLHQVVQVRL